MTLMTEHPTYILHIFALSASFQTWHIFAILPPVRFDREEREREKARGCCRLFCRDSFVGTRSRSTRAARAPLRT